MRKVKFWFWIWVRRGADYVKTWAEDFYGYAHDKAMTNYPFSKS